MTYEQVRDLDADVYQVLVDRLAREAKRKPHDVDENDAP